VVRIVVNANNAWNYFQKVSLQLLCLRYHSCKRTLASDAGAHCTLQLWHLQIE